MSIDLPGPVQEAFTLLGLPWVDIEEDDLRSIAGELRSFSSELRDHRDAAGQRLQQTGGQTSSQSYAALVEHWSNLSHGHMEEATRILEDMASGLGVAADAVVAIKTGIIAAVTAMAAEMAADAAAAVMTFGLAAAAEPAIIAATRTIVSNLLSQLEQEAIAKILTDVFGGLIKDLEGRVDAMIYQGAESILT